MESLVLYEDEGVVNLLPLLYWRSLFELQIGRKIVMDRLAQRLGMAVSGVWTRDWLAAVAAQRCGAPANLPLVDGSILVNGRWLCDEPVRFPDPPCVGTLESGETVFIVCDPSLTKRLRPGDLQEPSRRAEALHGLPRRRVAGGLVRHPWDVVRDLPDLLRRDWSAAEASVDSKVNRALRLGPRDQVHVGERVEIHPTAVVDAAQGAVYVSDDVVVGAFAILEGPLYLGPGTRVYPRAWLHGGNAVGPVCRIGGELHGCVIHGYSNKQHDGFLGHSYVGSWVNFGAGSVNSDLKNTYGRISVPINGTDVETDMQFFGAVVGDHAKLGINAAIPTGAAIGLGASISATRMLPKYIPSFSWVTDDRVSPGDPLKALDVAAAVMSRRNIEMTDEEVELFLDLGQRVRQFESGSAR